MRFGKGTKVEIFSTKEVPIGAWRCAEIISGNGQNYTVKYGWFPATKNPAVEGVPRKVIRPVPPSREGKFISGDVIEVFDNLSWEIGKIVDNFDDNYFLVRVFGLNLEIKVHKSRVRIRQCLKDGNWFVIGKVNFDSCTDSIRVLKRRFDDDLFSVAKKRRVCEDVHEIDFVDEQNLGEDFMDSCFRVGVSCSKDSVSTISGDNYSCNSSVGSCSVIGGNAFGIREHDARLEDDCESDAESSCRWGNEERSCSCSDEELGVEGFRSGLGAEGCRSELVHYHYAIREIFASGLLSWEDEAKLTNLREQLQISDDEHLMAKHMGRFRCFIWTSGFQFPMLQYLASRISKVMHKVHHHLESDYHA